MLRSMILAIIPKAYRSYLDIIAWCKQKTQILRTRELSDFTRRPTGSSGYVKATWGERMAMANDHRIDDQGNDAHGESCRHSSLYPRNQRRHGLRSYLQQSGSQAQSRHRPSPLASDLRDQPTRTPEFQLVSNLLAVGTARIPITLAASQA